MTDRPQDDPAFWDAVADEQEKKRDVLAEVEEWYEEHIQRYEEMEQFDG